MPAFSHLPLVTRRLRLRLPTAADPRDVFALYAEAMRYWSTPPWTAVEQADERIARDLELARDGTALRLLLEPRAGGPVLGAVALFAFDEGSRRAEIGYILARPVWGQGYAQEALAALLTYGFGTLGLRRVEADIDPRNTRSQRCLERLGFAYEGLLHERWVVGDEVSDTAYYGLLARNWSPPLETHAARDIDV